MGLHGLGWKQVAIVGTTSLFLTTFICAGELRGEGGGGRETKGGNGTRSLGRTVFRDHQGTSQIKALNQESYWRAPVGEYSQMSFSSPHRPFFFLSLFCFFLIEFSFFIYSIIFLFNLLEGDKIDLGG